MFIKVARKIKRKSRFRDVYQRVYVYYNDVGCLIPIWYHRKVVSWVLVICIVCNVQVVCT